MIAPVSATRPSSMVLLLSRIWPGPSAEPSSINSSPVDNTATWAFGRRRVAGVDAGQHPGDRWANHCPGGEHRGARGYRRRLTYRLSALAERGSDSGATVEPLGVFNHDHCISTSRHRCAGHDPESLRRVDQHMAEAAPAATSSATSNSVLGCTRSSATHCIAVDGTVFERWDVLVGDNAFSEHAPSGIRQSECLWRQHCAMRQHEVHGLVPKAPWLHGTRVGAARLHV